MASLKDLREKQSAVLANARELLDKASTDEARAAEYETEHDTAMAEYDRLGAQIERHERMERVEGRASENEQRARDNKRPRGDDVEGRGDGDDKEKLSYRYVFAKVICGTDPSELEPEERAILKKGTTKFEGRAQSVGTTTAGGFTVPTELLKEIEIAMKATGPMYDGDIVRELVTAGGHAIKLPTIDDTASVAVAHTENTALTDDGGSDVTFGQKALDAYAFDTEFIRWSWELESDSIFAMEALIAELLSERLGKIANLQLTTGTGSSAPNGIVTASSLGHTAAVAAAITADELIDLEHSVDPAYRKALSVGYMWNDSTFKAVRKLKDGDGNYLWNQGNVVAGVPATYNGYRYHVNQAMDSLAAAKKVVLFGDFKKYWVRKIGGIIIGVMRERFWPDLGIAGLIRFDGELSNTAAVKHLITAAS